MYSLLFFILFILSIPVNLFQSNFDSTSILNLFAGIILNRVGRSQITMAKR